MRQRALVLLRVTGRKPRQHYRIDGERPKKRNVVTDAGFDQCNWRGRESNRSTYYGAQHLPSTVKGPSSQINPQPSVVRSQQYRRTRARALYYIKNLIIYI